MKLVHILPILLTWFYFCTNDEAKVTLLLSTLKPEQSVSAKVLSVSRGTGYAYTVYYYADKELILKDGKFVPK